MALDLTGNIVLTISVTTLFLLILGLPLVHGLNNKKNLVIHGYLTIVALILQSITIFWVMIPSFLINMRAILTLPPTYASNTWVHFIIGIAAETSGAAYIALWLLFSTSKMRCAQVKKYMLPTFIAWILAIVTGALIHILQMF